MRTYKGQIDKAFQSMLVNPEIGRRKDNYFIGCYCFTVGRHVIFYRRGKVSIQVIRVLHESRDIGRLL